MAVVIETTIGDFTVDLFVDSRPQACKNFLKLCKMKYYNFCLFHSVQPNFLAQTGDPSGTGSGGESIYGLLYGENVRYFEAETMPKLKHNKPGLLSMVNCGSNMLGSQFFITLGEDMVSLDGVHCVFGEIAEGAEVVLKLNEAICDNLHRPYKDIRITHTIILEDPFEDPSGLVAPDMSPEATQERLANGRIAADEEIDETAGMTAAQVEEMKQQREASARATILEIVGDLPDAEMAPPENVLFVCKLNPVTTDDDLEIIFSRFGKVKSCEVIRDKTTGDSLQYAFVEFEDQKSCEEAYFKMDNVLIDDRRIHVDFSQSVAKMQWRGKGRGVIYHDNKDQVKDVRSSSHRERENSKNHSRRDRDLNEKERRKDRGREREEERQVRERGRDRDVEDRHRKRDDRDRSRTDWRKRDSKHRKYDDRDDDKRYDSKRKENDSFRRKDDDSKRVSSNTSTSRKFDDKRLEDRRSDDKRSDERKREKESSRDKESRDVNSRNSNNVVEKQNVRSSAEKIEIKEKEKSSKLNSPVPNISKEDICNDKLIIDSREVLNVSGDVEISPQTTVSNEDRINHAIGKRPMKEEKSTGDEDVSKEAENGDTGDEKSSQKSEKRIEDGKKSGLKKKSLKRKRKMSESRKRKKRRHSSSSESSSESSDSSDSSSSSDSSDHKHGKKKKLIVAKRYYRGGKLVKEIKKKKRTKDTTESESVSEDSSETDSKRKHKSKKHKKVVNIVKHHKRKNAQSSDEESQSESSSSDESDFKDKKKKRKIIEKRLKKKYKNLSSKKKRHRKEESTSSSESEGSVQNSVSSKSSKKLKKSAKNLKNNASVLEMNNSSK